MCAAKIIVAKTKREGEKDRNDDDEKTSIIACLLITFLDYIQREK